MLATKSSTLTLSNTNATGAVLSEIYKNKPTAGTNGDVLHTQSVFGKDSGNLCKTPALANNHARWNDIQEVGCIECLEIIYKNKLNKFPLQK